MIVVDPQSPVPPYEQIREQLTNLIRCGALEGRARLPSIRQLAGDLRIAPGTVARAYSELESDGLIESSRAYGTWVRPGQKLANPLDLAADQYVEAVMMSGIGLEQAQDGIRAAWERRRRRQ